ncbi:DUF4238 domain-containing protein [Thalassotalea sp. ND16A]|uniref:DUF4238 domain-containing protein n=1 Tax=Thalassotalea sp. ND16A TaxID=1535422 RepID=UPI00051DABAF|nr:DUF4238 domain-containing protein [Thalassotalea sp. ND16A]KGJ95996.1 hypothetical protein ND16A_1175 [Thalassotalea sp. ND16A]
MDKDNQHYVPRGYLRGFTIPGEKSLIWQYDKNTGEIFKRPKSVNRICSEFQYYAQKNEDGSTDKETMENAFHEIEDKTPRIIKKINSLNNAEKVIISEDEKAVLSFFTAMQLTRVPNFRNGIEEMYRKVVEIGLSHQVDKARKDGTLPVSIDSLYKQGKINIDIESFVSLKAMLATAQEGAINLMGKVWHFAMPAKGMSFVTSDNPVFFQAPEKYRELNSQIGPFHPVSEVTLPLSSDLLLIFSPSANYSKSEYDLINMTAVQLDEKDTDNLNKRSILAAKQYVYSSENNKDLAKLVSQFKGSTQHVTV